MSEEYRKLWHDRIDAIILSKRLKKMTTDIFDKIIESLSQPNLGLKLKAKFDKGMAEHGMGFEKVDFDAEIENEILDICNYLIGKHYSKNDGN